MKVALSVEHADPSRGGAETYMHWLAGRLARDGHEVHVFARSLRAVLPEGVVGHAVRPRRHIPAACVWNYCKRWEAAFDGTAFDVIHAASRTLTMDIYQPHGGTLRGSMEANVAMLNPAARWVRGLRWTLSVRRRSILAVERRQFARAREIEIVAVSQMVRNDIQRFYGVPPERITVVYNGVDVDRLSPAACADRRRAARARHGFADDDVVALLVAHNPRLKGLDELIAAVARARGQGARVRLLVVGGFRPGRFARAANRLGCGRDVTFTGPIDDVRDAYAAADVYAQPTYYDPCSLTVLEALACGLPVITTRQNGVSELVTDGREGFILEQADVLELCHALRELCDADRRREMGSAARALAEQHSTERNYRDILSVYERVADGKRRR